MEKSLTPRRFSKVGRGEAGSWVGRFCVKRSTAKIWFSRRLAAVAVIEEASSVQERNDAEDLDALA